MWKPIIIPVKNRIPDILRGKPYSKEVNNLVDSINNVISWMAEINIFHSRTSSSTDPYFLWTAFAKKLVNFFKITILGSFVTYRKWNGKSRSSAKWREQQMLKWMVEPLTAIRGRQFITK